MPYSLKSYTSQTVKGSSGVDNISSTDLNYDYGIISSSSYFDFVAGNDSLTGYGKLAGILFDNKTSVAMGDGSDKITGIDDASQSSWGEGWGIAIRGGSTLDLGSGDDQMNGIGTDAGISVFGGSRVLAGTGSDYITGTSSINAGILISSSSFDLGSGLNRLDGQGRYYGVYVAFGSTLTGGSDSDTIKGSGTGDLSTLGWGSVQGIRIQDSTLSLLAGDDVLQCDGADAGLSVTGSGTVVGLGTGNDKIYASSKENSAITNYGGSKIDLGSGLNLVSAQGSLFGYFAKDSASLLAGADSDSLTFSASSQTGVGLQLENNCSISTGDGNDLIKSSGFAGINSDATSTINMGTGLDVLDCMQGGYAGSGNYRMGTGNDLIRGFGTGTFDGEGDFDTLELGTGVYTVTNYGTVGFSISNGSASMTVKNIEILRFASTGSTFNLAAGTYSESQASPGIILSGTSMSDALDGSNANDKLIGNAGQDAIKGLAGSDLLVGGGGIDFMTGGSGSDTFQITALSEASLSGSSLSPTFERITDFEIGIDKIDAPLSSNVKLLGAISTLTQASISKLLNTTGNFTSNSASVFTYRSSTTNPLTERTFLAINDSATLYSLTSDAVIEITGYSLSSQSLSLANISIV